MDDPRLLTLCTLVRIKNYTKTAKRLFITQPAVTHHIQSLEKEYDIKERHMDCGMTIFDQSRQDTHAGGSGCGCAAATLSAYILPAIASGEWKRVLFVPTGALM